MIYESVYPDYLYNGLPTSQCLALFYRIKIDSDKDNIDVIYQPEEIDSITWINFDKLFTVLFKGDNIIYDVYEYENGFSKPFKKIISDQNTLVNWKKEGLGIPYGHILAIKNLHQEKSKF